MAKKNVEYRVSLEDKFTTSLKRANKGVDTFEGKVMRAGRTITKVLAGAVVVKAIASLSQKVLGLGADLEQTEIAFATFLGSAEKGKKVIEDLNQFANVTPFNNAEIIKSGRILLAANIPAEKLTDTLKRIGDVAAGSKVPINELASIYAKSMNKGKLQAEELNQLAERGIPIIDVLAKQFNVTKQEVFDLGSKGKITSKEMESAFQTMTKEGGIFFNLMAKQSKSQTGLWSTFTGKLQLAGMQMGQKMLPTTKKLTKGLIGMADQLIKITKIPLSEKTEKERRSLNTLVVSLTSANMSEEERVKILEEIKELSPDVAKSITKEGDAYKVSAEALQAYNEQQINRIIILKEEEKITDLIEKKNKLLVRQKETELQLADKVGMAIENARKNEFISLRLKKRVEEIALSNLSLSEKAEEINKASAEENRLLTLEQQRQRQLTKGIVAPMLKLKGVNEDLLNINEDLNKVFETRDILVKRLGVDLSKLPGQEKEGGVTAVPGSELQDGITTIKSAAPKTFNINISKMIEEFNINTQNITETGEEVKEKITEALAFALADIQAVSR